jgi:hypothetical protein
MKMRSWRLQLASKAKNLPSILANIMLVRCLKNKNGFVSKRSKHEYDFGCVFVDKSELRRWGSEGEVRGDLVVEKNLLYVIRDAHKKMFMIDDDEPKIRNWIEKLKKFYKVLSVDILGIYAARSALGDVAL